MGELAAQGLMLALVILPMAYIGFSGGFFNYRLHWAPRDVKGVFRSTPLSLTLLYKVSGYSPNQGQLKTLMGARSYIFSAKFRFRLYAVMFALTGETAIRIPKMRYFNSFR